MTYQWHKFYEDAVLETDYSRMEQRIHAAESALRERQHELSLKHAGTPEERQAISDALNALDVLRSEAASWSGNGSKGEA